MSGGNKPHIIHVLGTPNFGGAQRLVLELSASRALQTYQHSVVFILSDTGNLLADFQRFGLQVEICLVHRPSLSLVPSYRLNKWLRHKLSCLFPWRLSRAMKQIQADIVHTHVSSHVNYQARAVLKLARLPWIWTLHGEYQTQWGKLPDWSEATQLVNQANAMVTGVGTTALEDINARQRFLPNKLKLIPNGINLERFRAQVDYKSEWRESCNIPSDSLLFGAAGRLVPVKRYEDFVEAAASLLRTGVDAHFAVAGSGPLHADLWAQVQSLGIEQRFHLVGFQSDMVAFLRELDVFVVTSRSETTCLALLEARAMGLPCIATAVGDIPHVLASGGGILVSPGSCQELVGAMKRMTSKQTRLEYGQSDTPMHLFSIEETARKYGELYQQLLTDAK